MSDVRVLIVRGSSGEGDNDLGYHLMNGFKSFLNNSIKLIEYENEVRSHSKVRTILDKGIKSLFNKEIKLISITAGANANLCAVVAREHFDLILVAKECTWIETLEHIKSISPKSLIYNYYRITFY